MGEDRRLQRAEPTQEREMYATESRGGGVEPSKTHWQEAMYLGSYVVVPVGFAFLSA